MALPNDSPKTAPHWSRNTPIFLLLTVIIIVAVSIPVPAQQAPSPDKGGIKLDEKAVQNVQTDLVKRSKKKPGKIVLKQAGIMPDAQAKADNDAVISALKMSPRDVDINKSPWEMFASQLVDQIQGSSTWKGIQLVASPISADWNNSKTGVW